MNVVVFGATGGTGRCLLEQARAAGHRVTAFVRDAAKLAAYPGLYVVQGDARDYNDVAHAVAGQDAVLCALGGRAALRSRRSMSPANQVCFQSTQQIVVAMQALGVRRLIAVTMHGICESQAHSGIWRKLIFDRGVVPLLMQHEVIDKTLQEQTIRNSTLDWVIVRPTRLTNGPQTGDYRVAVELRLGLHAKVSRADVAAFMLEQLNTSMYLRRTPAISNRR